MQKARELILLGEKIDASKAIDLGIAWKVVADEQLVDEAYLLANKLLTQPHAARGRAKKALNLASTLLLAEAMKLETSVTTQGMLDPEAAAARARAALGGGK